MKKRKSGKRGQGLNLRLLFSGVLALLFVLVIGVGHYITRPLAVEVPKVFVLEHGDSLKQVVRDLQEQGVLTTGWPFQWLVRLSGKSEQIKSGNYEITSPLSLADLYRMIVRGEGMVEEVRVINGWNFRQLRKALDTEPALLHKTQAMSSSELLQAIGVPATHPEGLFYPTSYYFKPGESDIRVLQRAHTMMRRELQQAWEDRQAGLPYRSPYEALIMASIIEKESQKTAEQPMIAGVFINRLKIGMRLQTDPTVIYGMGQRYRGNISRGDLKQDTPYNTYTRYGLPPTPIALPGKQAIHAALHPEQTDALYFVAKGDGSHHFSKTLDDHNQSVQEYLRNARQAPGPVEGTDE